jgi:hypothetical protein
MSLLLTEIKTNAADSQEVEELLERLGAALEEAGGELLEAQVTADHATLFAISNAIGKDQLEATIGRLGLQTTPPAEVRLVGATIDEVRSSKGTARYLVEWDLPAGLTMEAYLARKKEKSPLYAQVPEVKFLRTYVREDMGKCLCFYDAGCESDVRKAREVVAAPVDRLHELEQTTTSTKAGAR